MSNMLSKRKKKRTAVWVWALIWPDGDLMCDGPGTPAVFFTRGQARTFRYNSTYKTPRIVRLTVDGKK